MPNDNPAIRRLKQWLAAPLKFCAFAICFNCLAADNSEPGVAQHDLKTTYSETLRNNTEAAKIIAHLESARKDYLVSYSKGDAETLSKLYHPNGTYTVAGVTTEGREKIIEMLAFAARLNATLLLTVTDLEMTSPTYIVEKGLYDYSAVEPRQFVFSSTYQLEWQKEGEQWLIKRYRADEPEQMAIPDFGDFGHPAK